MDQKLIDRHKQEWEEHFKRYSATLEQVQNDEHLIRINFGMSDDILPPEWKDKIDRDRQAWVDEWGLKGRRSQELSKKQEIEMHKAKPPLPESLWKNAENYTPDEYRRQLTEIYRRLPELMIRDGDWHDLVTEHKAIRDYYEKNKMSVPLATERQLSKQVADFYKQWQHGSSAEEIKRLDDATLQNADNVREELMDAQMIIEQHYHDAGMELPPETLVRQIKMFEGFDKEVSAYRITHGIQQDHPHPELRTRDMLWMELREEHNAIKSLYMQEGEPIPQATQNRMAMQEDIFREQWDGFHPKIRCKERQTLNPDDLKDDFQSWRNLVKSHSAIERMYGYPDRVPRTADARMALDIQQFNKEIDQYKASLKQLEPNDAIRQSQMAELARNDLEIVYNEIQLTQKRKEKPDDLEKYEEALESKRQKNIALIDNMTNNATHQGAIINAKEIGLKKTSNVTTDFKQEMQALRARIKPKQQRPR